MSKEEVIRQLEDVISDAKSKIYPGGDNEIWEKDIKALEEAIRVLREVSR